MEWYDRNRSAACVFSRMKGTAVGAQKASWKVVPQMKKLRCALCAALLLILCLSCACAEGVITPLPMDDSAGRVVNPSFYLDDNHYRDPSIEVTIETYPWEKTVCYVARVSIVDPSQLRTSSAYGFNRKQVASVQDMANRMNAVVAVNGDYSYFQLSTVGCYLVRQGVSYCERLAPGRDLLIVDETGDMTILRECTQEKLAQYDGPAIVNTFNFGPGLVVDGEPLVDNYRAMFNSSTTRNQRAAICQVEKGKLEYVLAACEGDWESEGGGLTMREWSDFLMTLGVQNAYNLDGGNSTAIIFKGEKINAVQSKYHRKLSDIIYFASAYQE